MKTSIVMFQKDTTSEGEYWFQLREMMTKARNDGWNVVKLNANYIDLQYILDLMEKDQKERIDRLIADDETLS